MTPLGSTGGEGSRWARGYQGPRSRADRPAVAWGALKDELAGEFASGEVNVGVFLCHSVAPARHHYVLRNVVGKLGSHGVWGSLSGLLASEIVAQALGGFAVTLARARAGILGSAFLGGQEVDNLLELLPGQLLIGR